MRGLGIGSFSVHRAESPATEEFQGITSSLLNTEGLHTSIGATERRELLSLARESDPQLFFEGLLSLGMREEQADHLEFAGAIYSAIAGEGAHGGSALQQRARQRLDAIVGRGAIGNRAEVLLRRFSREVASPSMLVGMAGAQAVFGLTRLALLSRLAASPTATFLTRGVGAKTLASVGAFALEAPSFVAFTRATNATMGQSQDWSLNALGREVASSYLTLGSLKAMGALVNPLTSQATRLTGLSAISQRWLPQVGMFAGIVVGHQLETRLGLREHVDGATTLVDSLSMLLQFNVGGRLMGHAFGPRFEAFNREIHLRSEGIAKNPPTAPFPDFLSPLGHRLAVHGAPENAAQDFSAQVFSMSIDQEVIGGARGSRGAPDINKNSNSQLGSRFVFPRLPENCRCLLIDYHDEGEGFSGRRPETLKRLWEQVRRGFSQAPSLEEARFRLIDGSALFFFRGEDGVIEETPETADSARALEEYNRYPEENVHRIEILSPWQPRKNLPPLPELLRDLRRDSRLSQPQVAARIEELTGEKKDYNTISRYERSAESAIPFQSLRALAKVYGVSIRALIQASNETRFPEIPSNRWSTQDYPIYLENEADAQRMEYFAKADPRHQSFGWMIYAARKNPFHYHNTVDLEPGTGFHANAFGRLEQNGNYPSLLAIQGLSRTLGLSEDRLIQRANATFHPNLDLGKLFPGQTIYLDPYSEDVRKVSEYESSPGSMGQRLFAYRKSLPDRPGVVELSRRLNRHDNYWGEREFNKYAPEASNWRDWYDLLTEVKLPLDTLRPFLGADLEQPTPSVLFHQALNGEALSAFAARTGFDRKGLSLLLSSRGRATQPETILDLQLALPNLKGDLFYRALRPELPQFFPEAAKNPPRLRISSEDIAEAMALNLGEALYAYRMDRGVELDTLAGQLGIADSTLKNYESISVQIENPEVLRRAAALLDLDPRVVYLHYHPQILRLFSLTGAPDAKTGRLDESTYRYWIRERAEMKDPGNLRENLFSAAAAEGIDSPDALAKRMDLTSHQAKKYWQKIHPLTVTEIARLALTFPRLSYPRWYEHFHGHALAYFLGRGLDGEIDYRLPEGMNLASLNDWDIKAAIRQGIEARYSSPKEAAQEIGVAFLADRDNLNRGLKDLTWSNDTIARVARGLGIDRRLLFLYFRRREISPMLETRH
ncbi:MAG: helix-turn-helix domain-containing protein [Deltaproteobacteria bacterium]|nr:helix-turn-helix domain-containing protein [Deltaproteobacteria bacterium]